MAIEFDFLLLETGNYLLLEDGNRIIIAEREVEENDCRVLMLAIERLNRIGITQSINTWGGAGLVGFDPWKVQ